jgi:hypothetical protein
MWIIPEVARISLVKLIVFLPIFLIFFGMSYVIEGNRLYFRMLCWKTGSVDILDIVSIKRTYNPMSSCAASLKRLEITFIGKSKKYTGVMISPVREDKFFEALQAVNPHIRINAPNKKGFWRFWDWDI